MIPKRIIRTVPTETSEQVERWWQHVEDLHPLWETVTYRDPIGPDLFPITSPLWTRCQNGAQLAGLIRLEALLAGGIYLDSDIQLFRALDPLAHCSAFAGWEDANTVPDAVIGATRNHPAIRTCLALALERLLSDSTDWRTGNGAWSTGPGVTTTTLPGRADVLLLPPACFYPIHYSAKDTIRDYTPEPFTFGIHHWHASWLEAR